MSQIMLKATLALNVIVFSDYRCLHMRLVFRVVFVLIQALKATGLRTGDPRLKECMETLKQTLKKTPDGVTLDRHLFKK